MPVPMQSNMTVGFKGKACGCYSVCLFTLSNFNGLDFTTQNLSFSCAYWDCMFVDASPEYVSSPNCVHLLSVEQSIELVDVVGFFLNTCLYGVCFLVRILTTRRVYISV